MARKQNINDTDRRASTRGFHPFLFCKNPFGITRVGGIWSWCIRTSFSDVFSGLLCSQSVSPAAHKKPYIRKMTPPSIRETTFSRCALAPPRPHRGNTHTRSSTENPSKTYFPRYYRNSEIVRGPFLFLSILFQRYLFLS